MKNLKGQSIIEILIVFGIMGAVLPALLTGFVSSRETKVQDLKRIEATGALRKSLEAVRIAKEQSWNNVKLAGVYHDEESSNSINLVSGSQLVDGFIKQIVISDVQRNASSGNIVSSGGVSDPATKKVAITISWTNPKASNVSSETYISRYINNDFKKHSTTSDFSTGTFVNTETFSQGDGAVRLVQPFGSLNYLEDYTTESNYTYDSNKIEVTGGYAQLKSQASPPLNLTTNGTFNTNSASWTFASYGASASTGTYSSTLGNPGGHVRLNFSTRRNTNSGGFWRQTLTTTGPASTATLSFDWNVSQFTSAPTSLIIYAYIDNGTGTPTTQVWSSGIISSPVNWSSVINLNIASFLNTAGTRYLKLATYVVYPNGNRGPYTIGFDNVSLNISYGGGGSGYPSDSPSISWNNSFTPSSLTSWDTFSENSILNGGSINYQLSDDDGSTWQYFTNGSWQAASLATNYNDATTVDQNINTFSTLNGKINVKAFLTGDGSQQVRLDSVTIGYTGQTGNLTGTFESSTIDFGAESAINRFIWTENKPSGTSLSLQIAINNDNSTWNYVGTDGTNATSFSNGQGVLALPNILGRYLKYKATFSTSNSNLPYLEDFSINYAP